MEHKHVNNDCAVRGLLECISCIKVLSEPLAFSILNYQQGEGIFENYTPIAL